MSLPRSMVRRVHGHYEQGYLEYALSYKVDGDRMYLGFLLVGGDFVSFTMGRDGRLKRIDMNLHPAVYEGTLFDVELVNGDTFVVFDCARVYGNACNNEFYPTRLELARYLLRDATTEPACSPSCDVIPETRAMYPSGCEHRGVVAGRFSIVVKVLFYANMLRLMPTTWIYPTDGLIWTLVTSPFNKFGHDKRNCVKWKPVREITIDFVVEKDAGPLVFKNDSIPTRFTRKYRREAGRSYMLVDDNGTRVWFSCIEASVEPGVYECKWDISERVWSVKTRRLDKDRPNTLQTVLCTLVNMEEAITLEDLYQPSHHSRDRPCSR